MIEHQITGQMTIEEVLECDGENAQGWEAALEDARKRKNRIRQKPCTAGGRRFLGY